MSREPFTLPDIPVQYNVPVKVLTPDAELLVEGRLRPYSVFTDRYGNLEYTIFSQEHVPYAGRLIVIKTLKEKAAQKAYEVLSELEGLLVLPITTCPWEKDGKLASGKEFKPYEQPISVHS